MSVLVRFLHPPLVGRRAYSSFFSSKPGGGGGRYFNSAKSPKVIVPTNTRKTNAKNVDPVVAEASAADGSETPAGGSSGSVSGSSGPNPMINPNKEKAKMTNSPSSQSPSPSSSTNAKSVEASTTSATPTGLSGQEFLAERQHPVITAKDFKIHHFFSIHRPLLLLSKPSSILESSAAATFDPPEMNTTTGTNANSAWLPDEFSETSLDADAVAARQLSRALTMSHAGATVAWEATLSRLGFDVGKEADRVGLQQQLDKVWQDVMMDSVKRKRRKKMKKHKLKKRRKATRATRLKIGR